MRRFEISNIAKMAWTLNGSGMLGDGLECDIFCYSGYRKLEQQPKSVEESVKRHQGSS